MPTLVVEDGTAKTNANTYASVATADTYADDRGITSWTALTTTEKEVALIKGTDYLEATYRLAWRGFRKTATQSLSWPRTDVEADGFTVESGIIPSAVVSACIEAAIRASSETMIEDQTQRVVREKVDVIEVEYAEFSDSQKRFPAIERLISPYLTSYSGGGGMAITSVVRT